MQGTDGALGFDPRRWSMTTDEDLTDPVLWRIIATRLACALESVLDSPQFDYGYQLSDECIEEANAALDARLAIDKAQR